MLFSFCIFTIYITSFFLPSTTSQILLYSFILFKTLKLLLAHFFEIDIACAEDISPFNNSQKNNRSHIVACTITDKIELKPDFMKTLEHKFFENALSKKFKKILHFKYGLSYWSYAKEFNFHNHIEIFDKKIIKKELDDIMAKHSNEIQFEDSYPNWKILIFINYDENESAILFKVHHGLADGVALMNFLLCSSENKEVVLPKLSKKTFLQEIFFYITIIYSFIVLCFKLLSKKADRNNFKKEALTGLKSCFVSEPIDINKIKKYAKENHVKINDILIALFSKSLYSYHEKTFHTELEEFNILIPVSLRNSQTKIRELNNRIVFLSSSLLFHESSLPFESYVQEYHKVLNYLKNSNEVYIQELAAELICNLFPRHIFYLFYDLFEKKHSCIFTNLPGPQTEINILGIGNAKRIFFAVNSVCKIPLTINIISYKDDLVVTCFADESSHINCEELMGNFKGYCEKYILNE